MSNDSDAAPEPYLSACPEVVTAAVLHARMIGWSGEQNGLSAAQSGEVAELMDAIHSIPALLQRWEDCDEAFLRLCLKKHLLAVYEQALANPRTT